MDLSSEVVSRFSSYVCNGDLENVETMILSDSSNMFENDGKTFLWGVYHGHLPVVMCFEKHGFPVADYRDVGLQYAATQGHQDLLLYFIEKGADIHIDGERALNAASGYGYLDIVNTLIGLGADVNCEMSLGGKRLSSLAVAVINNQVGVVECLLANHANINVITYELLKDLRFGGLDAVKMLVESGSDIGVIVEYSNKIFKVESGDCELKTWVNRYLENQKLHSLLKDSSHQKAREIRKV